MNNFYDISPSSHPGNCCEANTKCKWKSRRDERSRSCKSGLEFEIQGFLRTRVFFLKYGYFSVALAINILEIQKVLSQLMNQWRDFGVCLHICVIILLIKFLWLGFLAFLSLPQNYFGRLYNCKVPQLPVCKIRIIVCPFCYLFKLWAIWGGN